MHVRLGALRVCSKMEADKATITVCHFRPRQIPCTVVSGMCEAHPDGSETAEGCMCKIGMRMEKESIGLKEAGVGVGVSVVTVDIHRYSTVPR
jgi:hypothetical protein